MKSIYWSELMFGYIWNPNNIQAEVQICCCFYVWTLEKTVWLVVKYWGFIFFKNFVGISLSFSTEYLVEKFKTSLIFSLTFRWVIFKIPNDSFSWSPDILLGCTLMLVLDYGVFFLALYSIFFFPPLGSFFELQLT